MTSEEIKKRKDKIEKDFNRAVTGRTADEELEKESYR